MISTSWWNTVNNCTTPKPLSIVIQNPKSLIHPTLRQLCDQCACYPQTAVSALWRRGLSPELRRSARRIA